MRFYYSRNPADCKLDVFFPAHDRTMVCPECGTSWTETIEVEDVLDAESTFPFSIHDHYEPDNPIALVRDLHTAERITKALNNG